MGFFTRIIPSGIMFDDDDIPSSTPVDNTQTSVTINTVEKTYFLIDKIDIPATQIMLEARLIEVAVSEEEKLGIDWAKLASISSILVFRYCKSP